MYVVERLLESVAAIRYPKRPPRDPGARRLHRRDLRRSPAERSTRYRAPGLRHPLHPPRATAPASRPGALDGGPEHGHGRVCPHLRRRLRPAPGHPGADASATSPTPGSAWCRRAGATSTATTPCSPRCSRIMLDGHFVIEHGARSRSGASSTSTAPPGSGAAARSQDAGGWQHDTLTEDLDLSLPRAAARLALRLPAGPGRAGRAAGGDERLQDAAAALGQGLGPGRARSCCRGCWPPTCPGARRSRPPST